MGRKTIKRGPGKRHIDGNFHLAGRSTKIGVSHHFGLWRRKYQNSPKNPPEAPSDMRESPGKLPNPRRPAPRPIRSTSHWAPVHQLPRSDTRRRSGTCLMAVRASNLSP